jgi:hypothetical protein
MEWFRAYAEFAHDPKVQMMSEVMQRRLHMLMCLRCSNTLETLRETELAFFLRISEKDLAETKDLFIAKGFIDSDWVLLNWDKRQFSSDSSTERVRAYRERKKALRAEPVTDVKRSSNALEQNRTDTEQIQTRTEKSLASTSSEVPAAGVFELPLIKEGCEWPVPEKLFHELVKAYPGVSVMAEFGKMRAWLVSNPRNRKTPNGLPRFINTWLSRAQNRPHGEINAKPSRIDAIIASDRATGELLDRMGKKAHSNGRSADPIPTARSIFTGLDDAPLVENTVRGR